MEDRYLTEEQRKRRDELYREELERIQKLEEEKKFLFDKEIGGPDIERPSDDFIKECIGDLRSRQEINEEAGKIAYERFAEELKAEAEREEQELSRFDEIESGEHDRMAEIFGQEKSAEAEKLLQEAKEREQKQRDLKINQEKDIDFH